MPITDAAGQTVKIEIDGQVVSSYDIQENHYSEFYDVSGDDSPSTHANIHSYLANWMSGSINTWAEDYNSDSVGLFEGVAGPKNAPMVIIGGESNTFNARIIFKNAAGEEKVFESLEDQEVLDTLVGKNNLYTESGNYYLEVSSGSQWVDNQYSLTVDRVAVEKSLETVPNDDFSFSNSIELGKAYEGNLSLASDKDYFSFDVSDPSILNLNFNVLVDSSLNYYTVSFYNENFELIQSEVSGSDNVFEVTLQQSGDYYVMVTSGDYYKQDPYSFNITAFDIPADDGPPDTIPDDPEAPVILIPDNDYVVSRPIDTDSSPNVVSESADNGVTVGITAFAEDLDVTNNEVTYALTNNSNGRFAIGELSGVVTLLDTSLVDYEVDTSHLITVLASSSGGSTSSESFIIQVLDDTADNPNTISGSIYDDTLQGTDQDDTFVYEGGSDIILAWMVSTALKSLNQP